MSLPSYNDIISRLIQTNIPMPRNQDTHKILKPEDHKAHLDQRIEEFSVYLFDQIITLAKQDYDLKFPRFDFSITLPYLLTDNLLKKIVNHVKNKGITLSKMDLFPNVPISIINNQFYFDYCHIDESNKSEKYFLTLFKVAWSPSNIIFLPYYKIFSNNRKTENLAKELWTFALKGEFTDITFSFPDGRKLNAHRSILAVMSPVIKGMLEIKPQIEDLFENIPYEIVTIFLQSFYNPDSILPDDLSIYELNQLCILSKKYLCKNFNVWETVSLKCFFSMTPYIEQNEETYLDYLNLARQYKITKLNEWCLRFAEINNIVMNFYCKYLDNLAKSYDYESITHINKIITDNKFDMLIVKTSPYVNDAIKFLFEEPASKKRKRDDLEESNKSN